MDLEQRIGRLERRHRWLKLAALAGVLSFLFVVTAPLLAVALAVHRGWLTPKPKHAIVSAERFLLVDRQGMTRARLSWDPKDGTSLQLRDDRDVLRASLDVTAAGPGLALYDAQGKIRALVHVGHDGPFAALTDEHGQELFSAPGDAASTNPAGAQ